MSQSLKVLKEYGSINSVSSQLDYINGGGALGAVSLVEPITVVGTTAAATGTLGAGKQGQEKVILMTVDGGDFVLTPSTIQGGTILTFSAVGGCARLVFVGTRWYVVSLSAAGVALA